MREGFNGAVSNGEPASQSDNDPAPRRCDSPDCELPGEHRAPKSRNHLRDYYWFCLEHVRAYNSAWNYYAGMSEEEVEGERRADTYWHRPTRPFSGEQTFGETLNDGFGLFDDEEETQQKRHERFSATAPELAALAILNLSPPVTRQEIKSRYKELVKRHHPDANGGSKDAEERLKAINRAYETLTSAPND
ncbi:MAG: DnaJ domain-containing protein [Alphaproteobacteria bacterium]|nr:DnaJ domain-containing protein [Alphaproteobacteria bacterium]